MSIRDRLFGTAAAPSRELVVRPPTGMRRVDYASPSELQQLAKGGPSGADGDSWYMPVYSGGPDTTSELAGRAKYDVYHEMRTQDAAVRSVVWLYKLPIRAAVWSAVPYQPSEDVPVEDIDADVAAACKWQFGLEGEDGQMAQSWDESLQQALQVLDWGAMGEEIVWADELVDWQAPSGRTYTLLPIQRLAPRYPKTVREYEMDTKTGRIKRLIQDLPGASWIPGEQLAWYQLDSDGSSPWGTSLLRTMYGPWKLKKGLMIAAAIGWDRYAAGVPVVRYPAGNVVAEKRAQQIGRDYRVHERAYVALEGPATDGWNFEIVGGNGSLSDPTPLLRLYDEQIAMAGLQMWSKLGGTPYGSRAGAEVMADPWYLAVQAIAKGVAAERRRQVWGRWCQVNFGRPAPQLKVSKIQAKNVHNLGVTIANLAQAGLTFSDRDTQNDLRDYLDLVHLPDDVAAGIEGLPGDIGVTPVGAGPGNTTLDVGVEGGSVLG